MRKIVSFMKLTRNKDSRTRWIYVSVYFDIPWKTSNEYLSSFGILWVHTILWLDTKLCLKKITSRADERVEGEGYERNDEWHSEQVGSKFQRGQSSKKFFLNLFQDCIQQRDALLGETAWHQCAQCLTLSPRWLAVCASLHCLVNS